MIRGVAVVFGLVAIGLMVAGGIFVAVKMADWWHRRQELRRMERARTGEPAP